MENTNRKMSQFEILRVISMLLIIMLHFLSHGGVNNELKIGTVDYMFFTVARSFAYLGVNCFVLISGYFLCDKDFKSSRIFKIIIQVLFYSLLGSIIVVLLTNKSLSLKEILFTLFPLTGNKYWFASVYVVLLILSPVLNSAINKLNQKQHLTLVLSMVFAFSVILTFLFWSRAVLSDGKDITWFVTLYFIAAYLKKYPVHNTLKEIACAFSVCVLATPLAEMGIMGLLSTMTSNLPDKVMFFNNQFFVMCGGVLLFLLISNLPVGKVGNQVAKLGNLTFGVYLFHDNDLVRTYLWNCVKASRFLPNLLLEIVYMFFVVACIFICGSMIEFARKHLEKKLKIDRLAKNVDKKIEELISFICDRQIDCF